jgi:cytoskeletal protein RodZ
MIHSVSCPQSKREGIAMKMKKVLAVVTVASFLALPIVSQAAPPDPSSSGNSSSSSNSNSGSNSSSSGNASASAYSNGSNSMTNTKTTTISVGNVGISTNDSKNISKTVSISRSLTTSGNALSKNDLDQMVTNNQHAPIYDNHNPNSINNNAFENASGVMNVSQESGVNNSSMQTVNVNNSAGLH